MESTTSKSIPCDSRVTIAVTFRMSIPLRTVSAISKEMRQRASSMIGEHEKAVYGEYSKCKYAYVHRVVEHMFPTSTGPARGIKCRRCKSTTATIELKQTRSADEGMTSFGVCNTCGNRWKIHNTPCDG